MSKLGQPRSNGESVIVDFESDGKIRHVSLSREAIEDAAGSPRLTHESLRAYVQDNLHEVCEAARRKLGVTNPTADLVMIWSGEL